MPTLTAIYSSQRILAIILLLVLFSLVWYLCKDNQELSLSLLLGILFGIVLQRSRFCFFCMTREFIDERDGRGLLGLLTALAIGMLGYTTIFGAILPQPMLGRLPPDAHIGPVSWALVIAALVFGSGMSLSGSCISAHLYRLGEGAVASILALIGVLVGFIIGFATWNLLYLNVIQVAPVVWLPNHLGYGGALLLQLTILILLTTLLVRAQKSAVDTDKAQHVFVSIFKQRWPTYIGGLLIGFIATVAFFRIAPLGVTAELGSVARTFGTTAHWLPERLEGLDSFTGCATVVKEGLLSNNGLFIAGLTIAAWAAALFADQFKIQIPDLYAALRNFIGGVLMGWSAMTALGCTVGTLLSGIMAGALSGWVFAVFCFAGLWTTWVIRKRLTR